MELFLRSVCLINIRFLNVMYLWLQWLRSACVKDIDSHSLRDASTTLYLQIQVSAFDYDILCMY